MPPHHDDRKRSASSKGKGTEHPAQMTISGIGEDPTTGERWFDTIITADVVDRQGEVLDPFGFTLKEYRDILQAPIIDTHSNITVGRFKPESLQYTTVQDPTTGQDVAAISGRGIVHVAPPGYEQYPVWDEVWEHVKRHYEAGKPSGVSIGGDPDPNVGKQVRCQNGKCHIFVPKIYWYETSIVRTPQGPANPLATISAINASAKSQAALVKLSKVSNEHVSSLAKSGAAPTFAFQVPFLSPASARKADASWEADNVRRANAAGMSLTQWKRAQQEKRERLKSGAPNLSDFDAKKASAKWLARLEKSHGAPASREESPGLPIEDSTPRNPFDENPISGPKRIPPAQGELAHHGADWTRDTSGGLSGDTRQQNSRDTDYTFPVMSVAQKAASAAKSEEEKMPRAPRYRSHARASQAAARAGDYEASESAARQAAEGLHGRIEMLGHTKFPKPAVDEGTAARVRSHYESLPRPVIRKAANPKNIGLQVPGLTIAHRVEFKPGDTRSGKDKAGKKWSRRIHLFYGDFDGSTGADGEKVDFYANPKAAIYTNPVFIVNQVDQATGKFDEHKVVFGYTTQEAAKAAYLSNYPKGWKCGPVKRVSFDEFKRWLMKPGARSRMAKEGGAGGSGGAGSSGANAGSFAPPSGLGITTSTPGTTQFRVGGKMYDRKGKKRRVSKAMVDSIVLKALGQPATPVPGMERFGSSEEDGITAWGMPPCPADEPAHFQDAILEWMQAAGGPGAAQAQIQQALVAEQEAMMGQGRDSPDQPPSPFTLYLFRLMQAIQPPPPPQPMAQPAEVQPGGEQGGGAPDDSGSSASPSQEPDETAPAEPDASGPAAKSVGVYAARANMLKAAAMGSFRKLEGPKPAAPKDDSWLPANLKNKLSQNTPQAQAANAKPAVQSGMGSAPQPAAQAQPPKPAPKAKPAAPAPSPSTPSPAAPAAPSPPPAKGPPKKPDKPDKPDDEEDPLPPLAREALRSSGLRHTPSKNRPDPESVMQDVEAEEQLRQLTGDAEKPSRHTGDSPRPYLERLRELQGRHDEQQAREAEQQEEATVGKPFRAMQRDVERGAARSDKERRQAEEQAKLDAEEQAAREKADAEQAALEAAWQAEAEAAAKERQTQEEAFLENPYAATGIPDPYEADINAKQQQIAQWKTIPGNESSDEQDFDDAMDITGGDDAKLRELAGIAQGSRLLFDAGPSKYTDPVTGETRKRSIGERLQALVNSLSTTAAGKTVFGEDVEDRILSDWLSAQGKKVGDVYGRKQSPYDPKHPVTGDPYYNEKVHRFMEEMGQSQRGDRDMRRGLSQMGITMPDYMGHHSDVPVGPMGEVAAGRDPQELHIQRLMRDFGLSETFMRGKYRDRWVNASPEERFRIVQYESKVAEEMANRREAFIESQRRQEEQAARAAASRPPGQTTLDGQGNPQDGGRHSAQRPGR